MTLIARAIALQGFLLKPIAMAVQGFLANEYTPENGPSGGANWTRGYKPTHDYITPRRRSKRDELLFLRG